MAEALKVIDALAIPPRPEKKRREPFVVLSKHRSE